MGAETLMVTVFFLVPGLLALWSFEWVVVSGERSTFEQTALTLVLGLLAALPLGLFDRTQYLVAHLLEPGSLSGTAFLGLGLQSGIGIATGMAVGGLVRKFGSSFRKTFYRRASDWVWGHYADDSRYLLVTTTDGRRYWGVLEFAEDPSVGAGIVLRDPGEWFEEQQDFYRNGMKYLLLPGETIRTVELSVANPVAVTDEPIPQIGFVDELSAEENDAREEE